MCSSFSHPIPPPSLELVQISVLKNDIRELEQKLVREREFNSENSRTNVEYLTNILRKFLTCTNAAERASLSRALCQVLHFGKEETRSVVALWEAKTGFFGFLTQPRQVAYGTGPGVMSPGSAAMGVLDERI